MRQWSVCVCDEDSGWNEGNYENYNNDLDNHSLVIIQERDAELLEEQRYSQYSALCVCVRVCDHCVCVCVCACDQYV